MHENAGGTQDPPASGRQWEHGPRTVARAAYNLPEATAWAAASRAIGTRKGEQDT